jgi:predicted nucleic acid-binding protein
MRVAVDTNILVYAVGLGHSRQDKAKVPIAFELWDFLVDHAVPVLSTQVLGELFSVLVRRRKDRTHGQRVVEAFMKSSVVVGSDSPSMHLALDLAVTAKLQFWDALILATATAAGCTLFLSEDLQDGFAFRGMTVVNPFADPRHPRLAALLVR